MTKQYLPFLLLVLLIIACAPASDKAPVTPEAPSTPTPAAVPKAIAKPLPTEINKSSIDDAAAERIKNFMSSSFLTAHLPVMTEADKKFQLYKIDLNEDGLNEYFVRFNSSYFCGNAGCTFLLLNNDITLNSRFNVLSPPIYVSKAKSKGWRKMMVKSGDSFRELVYNDGKYPGDPAALPASKGAPGGNDEVLFDDQQFASKVYSISDKPGQMNMTIPVERVEIFQKTYNAGTFSFRVNAANGETTPIHITSQGLPRAYDETFEVDAAVRDGYLLDLNNDGFKELYIILKPTGDSGNLDIMGIASYRDKSAGEINVKDTKENRKVNSDKVYVQDYQLIREFIVGDETMKFTYKLSKGETGFVLNAVQVK